MKIFFAILFIILAFLIEKKLINKKPFEEYRNSCNPNCKQNLYNKHIIGPNNANWYNKIILGCSNLLNYNSHCNIQEDFYTSSNDIINNNSTQNIDTTLLSFPNKQIYNNPVIIYNKIKYSSNNLSNLIKTNLNEDFDNSECLKIQEESLKNPKVNTIIIGSTGYNTPLCYDYMNNLRDTPKKYSISNYINTPNNNNLIEGLQVNGDLVVPTDNLYKLQSLWGDNCKLEILKYKSLFYFKIL